MARKRRTGAAGQQSEPVGQPGGDLLGAEQSDTSGGELNGQGETIQPRADLGHSGRVRVGQRKVRKRAPGALDE